MVWEPPFEDDIPRGTMEALFEINAKLTDIPDHVAVIRQLLQEDEDGKEEEEG
jgi:hypothetical protein